MTRRIRNRGVAIAFATLLVSACSSAGAPAQADVAQPPAQEGPPPTMLQLAAPRAEDAAGSVTPALPTPDAAIVEAPAAAPATPAREPVDSAATLAAFDGFRTTSLSWGSSPEMLSMTALWLPTSTQSSTDAATRLRTAAQSFLAWLDAHPPKDCYRTVWQGLHDAAQLVVEGANAYLAGDAAPARARLQAAAQKLAQTAAAIPAAREACQAAG